MDNKTIAYILEEMGDILDIKGEDSFRIKAYKRAALSILNYPYDLRDIVEKAPNQLSEIPGIGQHLQKKIIELIKTGKCEEYEKLKKSIPSGLLEMLKIRTLGPKKVKLLYSNLKIKDIKELKKAAEKHLICGLEGMGEKSEEQILKSIDEYFNFSTKRDLLSEALFEAERIIEYMKKCKEVKKIEYAGSLRRRKETIGDIDILVTVKDPRKSHKKVMDHFVSYDDSIEVISKGDTKSTIMLSSGIHVDLRVVANESFGAAMAYFTGDKQHNIKMRDIAKKKGLKINEYGVFKGKKNIAGKTEEEVFKSVGLPFIIPEIRRDEGEIEYGLKNKSFPKFIELKDIKGDLHSHTQYSDGENTIEEMTNAMIKKGYEYFAITDHSSVVGVVKGMGKKDIKMQWAEIDKLNKKYKNSISILKGAEVDILKDGSLDFDEEVLKELDVVIIAAHLYNRLPAEEQTKRLITAIENPYSMILAHPSGRLLNKRAPMEFDMEKIINACKANKVALEINSNPQRLDTMYQYIKISKDKGVKFTIDTDSHSVSQPDFMEFGVYTGRRGWLEKKDVLNAQSFTKFDSYF